MRIFVLFSVLLNPLILFANDKVTIAILSSASKPTKLGENFRDNDSEGWDDIESHIRFGARLFSDRYCPKELILKDYDTQGTIEGTVKAIQAAEHDGAKVMLGFVTSSGILTVNKLLPSRKIPIVTLTGTHNEVARRHPPTLQLSYDDTVQGTTLGETILRLSKKQSQKILLLTDITNPYSVGLSKEARSYVEKKGVHLTEYEYATPLKWIPSNWKLSDFKEATALIMTGEGKEVLEVVTHMAKINTNYILVGGDGWYRGNVTQYLPNSSVFVPDTISLGHWTPRFTDQDSQDFGNAYKAKFKANPGGTAAAAHDAVKMICETWKTKKAFSFDSYVGMRVSGLTGIIHFTPSGKQDIKKPVLYWFTNGSYHDKRL